MQIRALEPQALIIPHLPTLIHPPSFDMYSLRETIYSPTVSLYCNTHMASIASPKVSLYEAVHVSPAHPSPAPCVGNRDFCEATVLTYLNRIEGWKPTADEDGLAIAWIGWLAEVTRQLHLIQVACASNAISRLSRVLRSSAHSGYDVYNVLLQFVVGLPSFLRTSLLSTTGSSSGSMATERIWC
jgi:hypothetical protein